MSPEEGNKAGRRAGRNVLWEGACLVWRKGGWGAIALLSAASWGGEVESKVPSSSPWDPVMGYSVGVVQSCAKGGLGWTLGSFSLPRGWSKPGTGLLERCLTPQACQCLRGIWTMPLATGINFWSALNWSGSWTGWSLEVLSNWKVSSILF